MKLEVCLEVHGKHPVIGKTSNRRPGIPGRTRHKRMIRPISLTLSHIRTALQAQTDETYRTGLCARRIITVFAKKMNPFSRALLDFHSGFSDAAFVIRRDDGFEQRVPAALFFDVEHYPPLESRALEECYGKILDIGSAAGRHSLELVRRGLEVTSLDILPEMEGIMKDRGLSKVVIADVFQFAGARFDTLLMLMNGIGMTGSPDGLIGFLRRAHDLINPGGQIVCDSIDVGVTTDPRHIAYRQQNLAYDRFPGQQRFTMEHDCEDSIRFDWLHIDFQSLSDACDTTGWTATLLSSEEDGHYVCRLTDQSNQNEQSVAREHA